MEEKVITDNLVERIAIKWDGERFAMVKTIKASHNQPVKVDVIVLSPREMTDIVKFYKEEIIKLYMEGNKC